MLTYEQAWKSRLCANTIGNSTEPYPAQSVHIIPPVRTSGAHGWYYMLVRQGRSSVESPALLLSVGGSCSR